MSEPEAAEIVFTVTLEHLKLLRGLEWLWNPHDFGGPIVDPARPYGGDVPVYDVASILYGDTFDLLDADGKEAFVEDQSNRDRLFEMHDGLKHVLEIGIDTGRFRPGQYRLVDGHWH